MAAVADNLADVRERIANACERGGRSSGDVHLVAVTKTVPVSSIRQAIEAGVRLFGENRVQEALAKYAHRDGESALDKVARTGIELHMIGALQRNKARQSAAFFDVVEVVDRAELADALDRAAAIEKRTLPVLLEINVTGESTKSGATPAQLPALADHLAACSHLQGAGLMTIARLGAGERELRDTFSTLRDLLESLRARYGGHWRELSMGMSDDFEIAIEEGATLIRLGRAIFGERPHVLPVNSFAG